MPSKKKNGQQQGTGGSGKPKKTVEFSTDEKSALLPAKGQEAKDSSPLALQDTQAAAAGADSGISGSGGGSSTNGGTFLPPASAEPHPHHRKPSISIIDGYNSPVRRGGQRSNMEVDEEAGGHGHGHGLGLGLGLGHGHDGHDHCVIALVENERTEHLSTRVRATYNMHETQSNPTRLSD